jgi:hypothetical protein
VIRDARLRQPVLSDWAGAAVGGSGMTGDGGRRRIGGGGCVCAWERWRERKRERERWNAECGSLWCLWQSSSSGSRKDDGEGGGGGRLGGGLGGGEASL